MISVNRTRFALCISLATSFLLAAATSIGAEEIHNEADNPHLSGSLLPVPDLSPADVIRIQIEALRNNDEGDRGIEVAFRFASPSNKSNTGPLARFVSMIKKGPYALMLGFKEATYGPVEVRDNRARQRVTLVGEIKVVSYWFYLSRQSNEPYADCWMTDAVYIEPPDGQSA